MNQGHGRRLAMVGPFGFHPNKTMRSRARMLALALVKYGYVIRIFMPPWQTPDESGRQWHEDGVTIRYTALKGGPIGIARGLIREVVGWQPDIVHTFKPKAYSGLTARWMWTFHRHKVRIVTDSDDWEGTGGWNDLAPYSAWQKRFFVYQERWGLNHNHYLTVASRALQSLAWAHGVPKERVIYLPNGPGIGDDVSEAAANRSGLGLANRPVVLLYSRLFEFDSERLAGVLKRVKAAIPDLAVLLVGSTLYEEDSHLLQRELTSAGLTDAIVDVGWVDEKKLPAMLAAADVGLYLMDDNLLNRTKCPVKLADMLQIGLPVVAEAVGQVPEYVIHRETGILAKTGDRESIAGALIELLRNQSERQKLGAGARVHIQTNFSWSKLARKAMTAYD